jgi:lysophospholipase L1-like esterase
MGMNKDTFTFVTLLCSFAAVIAFCKGQVDCRDQSLRKAGATLFFAGDSTLDDNGFLHPYRSWGRETAFYMKAGNGIENFAKSGASTKSFLADGHWGKLISKVKSGDFVLIQFGHNDQKRSNAFHLEKRWADPKGLFRNIVRGWVAEVRAKGASPILASPICRGTFDKAGKCLVDVTHASDGVCLGSYREAMEELSRELKCDYVDMNTLTHDLMERVGKVETEKFFVISTGILRDKDGEPRKDVTHPIKTGAEAFAKLFIDDVKARKLSVASLFRDVDFPITDFGAKPDGSKCTEAFAKAFAAAERAGGGRVVVPAGKWFSGAIHLRSNCGLHLSEGAEVLFSQDPTDYLPAVHTSWEGMECWNYSPLVYAYCCTNVSITGKGTLVGYEGEWKKAFWYPWVWQDNGIRDARLQLYKWGAENYPVEKRQIWKKKNANTRPHLVQFNRCKDVKWEDFKVRNSPFWTLHLYLCKDVSVRGVDIYAHGNNNDGIDIEMSSDVLVEKCRFDQGDDGVVIKSGRNQDAWRLNAPTENVFVRDCEIVNAHTVLGIGSEISGGVRSVLMKDCTARSVYRVFFLKTNRRRGGVLENIACENVTAEKAIASVFEIDTDVLYEWAKFPDYENRTTRITNIRAENICVQSARDLVKLRGAAELPPEKIRWRNLSAGKITGKKLIIENIKDAVEEP